MKKIFINAPLKDAETGKPYFPGEHVVGEDVPLESASRFVAAGYAEVTEETEESSEEQVPEV